MDKKIITVEYNFAILFTLKKVKIQKWYGHGSEIVVKKIANHRQTEIAEKLDISNQIY